MIEKLIIQSRNAEISNVTNLLIEAFNKSGLNGDPHLSKIFSALNLLSGPMSLAINRMKAESALEGKDENRDNAGRGVFFTVQAALFQPDEEIRTAAQSVNDVLEKYGLRMLTENYSAESGLIVSLLNELDKPQLQTAIAAIPGCTGLIDQLKAAQDDFEAASLAYEEEKGQEGELSNATELKKAVVNLVNTQLVVYLNGMQTVDVETYGALCNTLKRIISDNNIVVRKRRRKTKDEEESS